ncbi:MAG: 2-keto-4-pentenoate hydratase [Sandaracinus sp.]|nr:2-keto-4-pentenoate hydratase [Sandaracinus sp.]
MRLATRNDGTRDGELVVVAKDGKTCAPAGLIAPTLQQALDRWDETLPALQGLAAKLDSGDLEFEPLDPAKLMAPLPRAYEWVDGSAYINHIVLVRKARNAEPPETLETDPLVYQGGSGVLLGPRQAIPLPDEEWGCDFEAEICVVLGDTPRGVKASEAAQYVKLVTICNDVTYRNLIPAELKKNFGFFQSKPATGFAPFMVTPDELGPAWQEGRVHLPLRTHLNGELAGEPDAGPAMHFSFFDLIQHITKTRASTAGTILGSGTVSNEDEAKGVSCLAERRMREILKDGKPSTRFLKAGDEVRIELLDEGGRSICGAIEQTVQGA